MQTFQFETGRWRNIPREDRICNFCNENEIGDEYQYLFIYKDDVISQSRNRFIPRYYHTYPNTYKFERLFNLTSKKTFVKLCKFINVVIERVSSPG